MPSVITHLCANKRQKPQTSYGNLGKIWRPTNAKSTTIKNSSSSPKEQQQPPRRKKHQMLLKEECH
jgi:hypothetical protein